MTDDLTTVFDSERRAAAPGGSVEPAHAMRNVHQVLDAVVERTDTESARLAVETVRAALAVLDAVRLQPASTAPPPLRTWPGRLLGRLFGTAPRGAVHTTVQPRVVVDVDRVLATVRNTLEAADRLRQDEPPQAPPQTGPGAWAADTELLSLLSDLLTGARRKSHDFLLARIAQLIDDLALEHDIDVVDFTDETATLFHIAGSTQHGEPRTTRPALVHHGVAVRAGEVMLPLLAEGQSR